LPPRKPGPVGQKRIVRQHRANPGKNSVGRMPHPLAGLPRRAVGDGGFVPGPHRDLPIERKGGLQRDEW
jgi:hypothetical protein